MHSKSPAITGLLAVILIASAFLSARAGEKPREEPLFRFGLVADIQYSDRDTFRSMRFREVPEKLAACIERFNRESLPFVIEMGDIIANSGITEEMERQLLMLAESGEFSSSREMSNPNLFLLPTLSKAEIYQNGVRDLGVIFPLIDRYQGEWRHVQGNHDSGIRRLLRERFGGWYFYYSFVQQGTRFLILDTTEEGDGVLSERQLSWFRREVREAGENREKVLIFGHHPFLPVPGAARKWTYFSDPLPVHRILRDVAHEAVYFAGHEHIGGYFYKNGIHHVTLQALLESGPEGAGAVVSVYEDRVEIIGLGEQPSLVLPFGRQGRWLSEKDRPKPQPGSSPAR
ncbi:MAG: hypothetical protein V1918_09070 [Planctomycetota bacterium]